MIKKLFIFILEIIFINLIFLFAEIKSEDGHKFIMRQKANLF